MRGHNRFMRHISFVWLCLLPLAVVTMAFFLLPMARLVVVGAEGPQRLAEYIAVLTEPRYRATMINTVVLAAAATIATLVIATIAGMFLQRHRFPRRAVLIAMLTFPLAFPGVVVGFLMILLAGRQGLIGDLTNRVFGEKIVFAYSIYGLFLGYLYFSIPRVILTIMAAVQKLHMRAAFPRADNAVASGPLNQLTEIGGLDLILLDSSVPGKPSAEPAMAGGGVGIVLGPAGAGILASSAVQDRHLALHTWFPGERFGNVVTHHVLIGDFDGPHPFFGSDGKLL